MKRIAIVLSAVLLLGTTHFLLNLQPDAEILIEALSPQELHNCGDPERLDECPLPEGITLPEGATPSNGLQVVGNGELVYLSATEISGEEVTAYAWSVASAPNGSSADVGSDAAWTTFRPDVPGQYTVEVTITTASGMATAGITITSAEYVGVGTQAGLPPDAGKGQCAACHPRQEASWSGTGHSTMFSEAIDGLKSDHYNEACIECHTVGFNEDPLAVNDGFDDVAAALGWTFPETLEDGNWDTIVSDFPQLAEVSNIQCENCHGPGSLHKGNVAMTDISIDEGVCGRCHEEDPYHRISSMWKNSLHAQGTTFVRGNNASCQPCHNGWGFIARNDVDPFSNLGIRDEIQNISCAVCHDPHDASNEHQLRTVNDVELQNGVVVSFGGNGKLCMHCHNSRENAEEYAAEPKGTFRGPHHNNQTDMLVGTNYISFGRVLPNSTHRDALEDTCVSCHMFETPADGEPGHDAIGSHTWNIRLEMEDGSRVDHVAACERCHGQLDSFEDLKARADHDGDGEIEGAQAEVEGLLEEVAMLLPPVGEPTVSNNDPIWNDPAGLLQRQAFWNYLYVEEDQSHGVHNYQLTVALLQLTKEALTYGVLSEGTIMNIADVPNDQGKQVSVAWTRFGGDGPSDAPLETYYVWRRVDAASKDGTLYETLADVPADLEKLGEGAAVLFDGALWTQVGSQPAAQMDQYSAVVPTLYDSTASGMNWSVFVVSGHTDLSTVYVVSEPDSAYSIDNLVPSAPSGITATRQDTNVQLTWEEPVDADFDYFAIYRGTTQGFDPSLIEPLATTTDPQYTDAGAAGTAYFYRLAAFDFSGNRSAFSSEIIPSGSTAIAESPGVPTEFELHQNYPNPFNPTTTISFAVPEASTVRIVMYDVSGKEVAVLVNRSMAPGNYNVTWDAEHFASGVYFYTMQAGSFVQSKTLLLVK